MNRAGPSRRTLLKWTAGTSAAALWTGRLPAWGAAAPDGGGGDGGRPATFTNPLFAGDHPDPTILRVGGDFYMTHTSYSFAPSLVVWHSRDLVNWLPISHVAMDATHAEVWSPDLVEHGGRYYIYFPMGGLYVVHADHPRGPWSAPINLGINDIDPGHVAGPDGKRYLYTAGGHVTELAADGLSAVGKPRQVYKGWQFPKEWKTEGFWLESPKLTRRGAYYYLICAEGGTAGPPTSHMSVVARSASPLGPWENSPHNPLIHTYSADEAWWSVGHGTLVSTPDDRWYFVYHGYRKGFQTLGRNTLMEPVEWTADGWPRAPLGVRRGDPMPAPMGVAQRPMIPLSDDFQSPELRATWAAWKEPDMGRYKPGGGTLLVRGKGESYADSSPLTVKARDESYTVQVVATVDGESRATLGLRYNPRVAVFAELSRGRLDVVGPAAKRLATREWPTDAAWLRMVNRQNRVEFLASEDGQAWQSLTADFDASHFDTAGHGGFQAARPALAAIGGGTARFADFRYVTP